MSGLLFMRKVKVIPHNPQWRAAFEAEAKHVAAALNENVVAIRTSAAQPFRKYMQSPLLIC